MEIGFLPNCAASQDQPESSVHRIIIPKNYEQMIGSKLKTNAQSVKLTAHRQGAFQVR